MCVIMCVYAFMRVRVYVRLLVRDRIACACVHSGVRALACARASERSCSRVCLCG